MRYFISSLIVCLVVMLDELVESHVLLNITKSVELTPFLNIVHVWNAGISFGLFAGEHSNMIFIALTAVIIAGFIVLVVREQKRSSLIAYSLIIGGAFGNLIDRIQYNAVFDFIDLHFAQLHWPAFNLADFFICIGAIMLFWNLFFDKKMIAFKELA